MVEVFYKYNRELYWVYVIALDTELSGVVVTIIRPGYGSHPLTWVYYILLYVQLTLRYQLCILYPCGTRLKDQG